MSRVFILFLALCLPVCAQDAPRKPKGGLQVRFVAQRLPAKLGKVVMTAAEDLRSDAFDLPLNNLSPRQVAPARTFLLKDEEKDAVLAKISLPAPGTDFVILLVLGEKAGYSPVVLPAKDLSFKPGDVYLHNTSKSIILGQVGTTKFVINPAKGSVIRPEGAREERFYDVMLGVREKEGNRVISTTRWPVDDRVRSYVFFFDDPKRKDVDFRAVDEFVPLEKN